MRCKYLGLALLSAAALAFEITLTRLFSVTQWYHFAFLAVSVALLGYGASGTALSLVPRWANPPTGHRPAILSVLFAASVIGAYLALNHLPFDSYRIAWERVQILYLVLYYLALTVPFFCAGLVTGLLLAVYPARASRVYGANLLGSALGGLLPVLVLPLVGEGTVLIIVAIGLLAALTFQFSSARTSLVVLVSAVGQRLKSLLPTRKAPSSSTQPPSRQQTLVAAASAVLLLACLLLIVLAWNPPDVWNLRLSPYKGLSQVQRFPDAETVSLRWNAFSRVDRVSSSAIRSAPGLSLSFPGRLPKQDGIFVDGDDLSPRLGSGAPGDFTAHLPVALPYQLRPMGHALVLEPRGGLDVVVALEQGIASVVAVESNPLLIEAAGWPYDDDRVWVVVDDGRSFAHRSTETFDIVHLSLGDSFRPVTSGAYSLGERYDLTVEAFEEYLGLLRPGGLLVVERWLQVPPSELLRVGAVAVEALQSSGRDPAASLVVLRSWQVGLILVKNGALEMNELDAIREFAQAQEMDLVALPGMAPAEANQLNVLETPVYFEAFGQLLAAPQQLYASHPADVRPATDDRPFFFHFFRWGQTADLLARLGRTWQPWGGSGYFVLFALLVVAAAASAVLILLPVVGVRAGPTKSSTGRIKLRVLLYFGLLGLGFLFVEIPLMQRFILFLGQPIYAFTAVLASVLFFSGLGSLASARLSIRWTLPALVAAILLSPLVLPVIFQALMGAPLALRLLATGLILAPLGFLMGTALPGGLIWLRSRAPALIPWAWAINGCASVLASVLAAIVAVSAGFSWVLVLGALAYAAAWLALR